MYLAAGESCTPWPGEAWWTYAFTRHSSWHIFTWSILLVNYSVVLVTFWVLKLQTEMRNYFSCVLWAGRGVKSLPFHRQVEGTPSPTDRTAGWVFATWAAAREKLQPVSPVPTTAPAAPSSQVLPQLLWSSRHGITLWTCLLPTLANKQWEQMSPCAKSRLKSHFYNTSVAKTMISQEYEQDEMSSEWQ